MVAKSSASCILSGLKAPSIPITAEYPLAFAPTGGRLGSRHVTVQGLDRLTAFLRQVHVPTPQIERGWRMLAKGPVHSIPRVGPTPAEIEALGL